MAPRFSGIMLVTVFLARPRAVLAFDASAVRGAILGGGLVKRRIRIETEAPLPSGALVPGTLSSNVVAEAEVRDALARVLAGLGKPQTPATLVLPDGIARMALLEIPRGAAPSEYVAYRLGSMLPYPTSEAIVGFRGIDRRRVLGAAMRRDVVAGYEAVARSAGIDVAAVEFAPIAGLPALQRSTRGIDLAVGVQVGDAAFSMALFRRGELLAFRSRRRAPGADEVVRIQEDVLRLAAAAGFGGRPRTLLAGPAAEELLRPDGWFEVSPLGRLFSWEHPWLGGILT